MNLETAMQLESKYLMHAYKRANVLLTEGKGVYVTDSNGKKYLDFVCGIGTCLIGHANPGVTDVLKEQASKLVSSSNLYYTEQQLLLAQKLWKLSGGSSSKRVFFSNSGTEANECAFKLARLCTKKTKIISVEGGFHGRTYGSLSATHSEKYRRGFEPLASGFLVVEDNLAAVENAIDENTAAVIIECIQGEAGVKMHENNYLKQLRKLTAEKNVLLIIDEVQTGNGRTGEYFAFQHARITPDVITVSKGLANGIPIAATISTAAELDFQPSLHGSTFGGNSLACAAANYVIDYVLTHELMSNAADAGNYFMSQLKQLNSPMVKEVRGKGLLIGVELTCEAEEVVRKCGEKGLLANCVNKTTLRFLPALIASKNNVDNAMEILAGVLK